VISGKNFLSDFERRGNINRKQLEPLRFLSAVECHLFALCKGLLTEIAETALSGEEVVGTGAQLAPK